jgi:hypothetical protein
MYGGNYRRIQAFRRNIKVTDHWEDMRRRKDTSKISLEVNCPLIHEGRQGQEIFFTTSGPALGPTQDSSPEVKRPERKAGHSPPPSAEAKNGEDIAPYLYHNDGN